MSFTFDDFPRSALYEGGEILRRYGAAGTYYASLGLMDQDSPAGRIFSASDLPKLLARGHELGSHTFSHCHAWETEPQAFENSVVDNQTALDKIVPGTRFQTLSFPISCPRPGTKRRMAKYFACCRAGGQKINSGSADLNGLSAFFLEQSRDNFDAVQQLVVENARQRGWVIFATHDVCDDPTRFGCSTKFFENVVQLAAQVGAAILPVSLALQEILGSAPNCRPIHSATIL